MQDVLERENDVAFEFEINGFKFRQGGLYQIVPKPDLDAPDGFIKEGTTKLLMGGIQESAPCIFNDKRKLWDTGFYADSPCYNGKKPTEVAIILDNLTKYIVAPYEKNRGGGVLRQSEDNNKFWDEFGGSLYNGRVFNIADEQDFLELYMAIRHFHIVSPEDRSKPFARTARYCIIDKEAATSVKEQRELDKAEAIGIFMEMYSSDKEMLFNVLEYIGLISSREIDKKTLTSTMMRYFEDAKQGFASVNRFTEVVKKAKTKKGGEELEIYATLVKLFRTKKITKEYGEFILKGESIGSNLKDATERIMQDPQLKITLAEAMD